MNFKGEVKCKMPPEIERYASKIEFLKKEPLIAVTAQLKRPKKDPNPYPQNNYIKKKYYRIFYLLQKSLSQSLPANNMN